MVLLQVGFRQVQYPSTVAGSLGVPSMDLGAQLEYRFSNVEIHVAGHHTIIMDPTVGY